MQNFNKIKRVRVFMEIGYGVGQIGSQTFLNAKPKSSNLGDKSKNVFIRRK